MHIHASNAIMTKVRAIYGRRLKPQNYRDMLEIKSVPEAAVYLRGNTHFAPALAGIKESAVHRGNLEFILRNKIFNDFASLCRFESSVGEHFYDYLILRSEYHEILSFLRYLKSGEPQNYLLVMPEFINKHMEFDLMALSRVRNYDQLIAVVKSKKITKILSAYRPERECDINFTAIEAAMEIQLFGELVSIIKKNFKGSTRHELLMMFSLKSEISNIKIIYRAKKYYGSDINGLIPCHLHLKPRQLDALAAAPADGFMDLLMQTKYKRFINTEVSLEDALDSILFKVLKKLMRSSMNPAVVFASYIELATFEINNITNIIEGIRYSLPPFEIEKLLQLQ